MTEVWVVQRFWQENLEGVFTSWEEVVKAYPDVHWDDEDEDRQRVVWDGSTMELSAAPYRLNERDP